MVAKKLYNKHIKGTAHEEFIVIERGYVCNIKKSLLSVLNQHHVCEDRKVYLSTKALKHVHDRHIYDKQTPIDFYVILDNFSNIIKYPDEVFLNAPEKSGDFIFVKRINGITYMASVQVVDGQKLEIVSASATGKKYLIKFTSLWRWGNG